MDDVEGATDSVIEAPDNVGGIDDIEEDDGGQEGRRVCAKRTISIGLLILSLHNDLGSAKMNLRNNIDTMSRRRISHPDLRPDKMLSYESLVAI